MKKSRATRRDDSIALRATGTRSSGSTLPNIARQAARRASRRGRPDLSKGTMSTVEDREDDTLPWEKMSRDFRSISERLENLMTSFTEESEDLDKRLNSMSRQRGEFSFDDYIRSSDFKIASLIRENRDESNESTRLLETLHRQMTETDALTLNLNGTLTNVSALESAVDMNFNEQLISEKIMRDVLENREKKMEKISAHLLSNMESIKRVVRDASMAHAAAEDDDDEEEGGDEENDGTAKKMKSGATGSAAEPSKIIVTAKAKQVKMLKRRLKKGQIQLALMRAKLDASTQKLVKSRMRHEKDQHKLRSKILRLEKKVESFEQEKRTHEQQKRKDEAIRATQRASTVLAKMSNWKHLVGNK